jgi:hypothetical protein
MTIEGESCIGVRVTPENGHDVDMYFGKQPYFLRRTVGKELGPDGKTDVLIEDIAHYKRFSGQLFATQFTRQVVNRSRVEQRIETLEVLPAKDVKHLFEKP